MSLVQGKNITFYVSGDSTNGLYMVGCEENCTINFTAEIINTTTRGTGNFRGREYGIRDCTITADGVIFINATSNPDSNADPMWFASAMLEGKKCVARFSVSDGSNSRYYIGRFIIQTAEYTGGAEGFGTYNVTLLNDGEVYKTDDLKTTTAYDSPSVYVYASTGASDGFTVAALANVDIYFIYRSGVTTTQLFEDIQVLALSTDIPTGTNTVGYHASSGTINFEAALVNGDFVTVVYNE